MSDRKYRQRGYQDDDRGRQPRGPAATGPKPPAERAPGRVLQHASGPKTPNLMATHEVFRCARCGHQLSLTADVSGPCPRCGTAVHSCVNCVSFDTGARFECSQPGLTARVSPKDERNTCPHFAARTTVERETTTKAVPNNARQAFDDLFNF